MYVLELRSFRRIYNTKCYSVKYGGWC